MAPAVQNASFIAVNKVMFCFGIKAVTTSTTQLTLKKTDPFAEQRKLIAANFAQCHVPIFHTYRMVAHPLPAADNLAPGA